MTTVSATRDTRPSASWVSSISRLSLSNRMAMIAWYRGKARISRLLRNAPSKTRTTHEATCRLPFETVEMIILYLTYDLDALKKCSLTCRSWYIIAVPHIHHTLSLRDKIFDTARHKLKPLSKLHGLGLLPFVREIRVGQLAGPCGWFGPGAFTSNDLFHFSTFSNVHTLRIQGLNIDRFMPRIEHYFHQFLPTLKTISLYFPTCSAPRHLSDFLSLFPDLDNVDIRQFFITSLPIPNAKLTSSSSPKFRGQLTLHDFLSTEVWTRLISVSDGLRFRDMVLRKVGPCASILLGACAETLETLRFYVTDDPGRRSPSAHKLDLSQLKVLRSLEVGAWTTELGLTDARQIITIEVFSTITSPVFTELIFVVWHDKFADLLSDPALFETLCTINEIRPFELIFLLQLPHPPSREEQRRFEQVLEIVAAKGLFDLLHSPPSVRLVQPYPLVRPYP